VGKIMIVAAATLGMAISMSPGADRGRDARIEGPVVVRLVQGPGSFEPQDLELKPGRYIFMVTNQGVDHEVDFVLKMTRSAEMTDDPSGRPVRNSRLSHRIGNRETASTGIVDLKAGSYVYSSALNPTPEFALAVR
jgi:plastocyanin